MNENETKPSEIVQYSKEILSSLEEKKINDRTKIQTLKICLMSIRNFDISGRYLTKTNPD